MKALVSRLCSVPLVALLASCMILPLPKGPLPDSRANIGTEVPAFIVAGVTSRSEVLLHLGDPDGAIEDDRRFIYTKRARTGGHVTYLCGEGSCLAWESSEMAYDRLTIQFNDKNVVASSWHERFTCQEGSETSIAFEHPSTIPCMNVTRLDLTRKADDFVFPFINWCRRTLPSGRPSESSKNCLEGSLVVSDTGILLYPENADRGSSPILTLPYAEIASIEEIKALFTTTGVSLKRTDGTYDSITTYYVLNQVTIRAMNMNTTAAALLLSRWKAAINK